MRVVFMGTPGFAVVSLNALVTAGVNVVAVVTSPDKPAGRGRKLNESEVKKHALSLGIPVLQPERLKSPEFIEELKHYNADLQVVVAFRMLPEAVWNMPAKGTINLHGSLLPQYRGAAPINWAVINGEKQTGVTTFFLKQEIDTGNIIASEKVAIGDEETAGDIHDKLMNTGAELLVKTVRAIEHETYREVTQGEVSNVLGLKYAPKIFKEDCAIRWNEPTNKVFNLIRGLSPSPTAFCRFQDKTLKIFKSKPEFTDPGISPGAFLSDGKSYLKFACIDGFISATDVQLEGKKRMGVEEFLRGVRI